MARVSPQEEILRHLTKHFHVQTLRQKKSGSWCHQNCFAMQHNTCKCKNVTDFRLYTRTGHELRPVAGCQHARAVLIACLCHCCAQGMPSCSDALGNKRPMASWSWSFTWRPFAASDEALKRSPRACANCSKKANHHCHCHCHRHRHRTST